MAEDLQGLLNRLQQEGVRKAESERDRIVGAAREEAERLVSAAKAEAERLLAASREESDRYRKAGEENLRQAARDLLIATEKELARALDNAARACLQEAMTGEEMARLVESMVSAYASRGGAVSKLEVLLPAEHLALVESRLRGKLGAQLKDGLVLRPVAGGGAGLKLALNGESVFHDLSIEALVDLLGAYLNPRYLEVLRQAAKKG